MPIYAYRCTSCGHQKDALQKISDPPLTECPACHAATFEKQVTAAGFQLKGSGWYVTDFRNNTSTGSAKKTDSQTTESASQSESKPDAAATPADTKQPAAATTPSKINSSATLASGD